MPAKKSIVVIGSSNTDMVVKSGRLPVPGETVLGGVFQMIPGGKGANQAVAAATLSGQVAFVAKVGNDMFGKAAKTSFEQRGIDTAHVLTAPETASGVALIMVDDEGENAISVALGANDELSVSDIEGAADLIRRSDFLLIQLEIPITSVERAVALANEHRTQVVLNPAPARQLAPELLQRIDIITPNESEAKQLTGVAVTDVDSAREAASVLRAQGVPTVIITMGAEGAYVKSEHLDALIPGIKVPVVDTTGAGDTFNGALTVALAEGMPLSEAIAFANSAAACSVTQMGAQTSAPNRAAIIALRNQTEM